MVVVDLVVVMGLELVVWIGIGYGDGVGERGWGEVLGMKPGGGYSIDTVFWKESNTFEFSDFEELRQFLAQYLEKK